MDCGLTIAKIALTFLIITKVKTTSSKVDGVTRIILAKPINC